MIKKRKVRENTTIVMGATPQGRSHFLCNYSNYPVLKLLFLKSNKKLLSLLMAFKPFQWRAVCHYTVHGNLTFFYSPGLGMYSD